MSRADFALRPVSPGLLAPLLNGGVAIVSRRHPDAMARLEPLGKAAYPIDPVELPFGFVPRLGVPAIEIVAAAATWEGVYTPNQAAAARWGPNASPCNR